MAKITEPGDYSVTVQTVEIGESSKGTPQIYLFFVTDTDPSDSIAGWLYLSPKALPHTVKALREAFDFDGDFENLEAQVKDKPCSITVKLEQDQSGNEQPRVQWINKAGGGYKSKPLTDAGNFLKNLTAQAKRIPKEAPKAAGTAPKAAPAAQAQRYSAPPPRPARPAAAPAPHEDPY